MSGKRVPNWLVGIAVVIGMSLLLVFAFNGARVPWGGGYELRAVFTDTNGIEVNSPVRIAGVAVGTVTSVEPATADDGSPAAMVTMEIGEEGLPIRADAQLTIRPRLFLEGNYFVDLKPGSPSAAEVEDGGLIAAGQTASSVALDEVLTTLQSDVRTDLRVVLDQFSKALLRDGGSAGLREIYVSSPGSFRSTSQVAQAVLGTEPGDLSALIRNLGSVTTTLAGNRERLASLLTNLRLVAGAFAVEADSLSRAIATLPETIDTARPVLAALNGSLPATRAFAREALPGVNALPETLDATTPLLRQLRGLVSRREARGLVADLRPAIPELASLTDRIVPLTKTSRRLSSCFNEVVIPWANETVEDPETPPEGRLFEEIAYGLVGIAGESRSGDGNGPYARVLGGSGSNVVTLPPNEEGDETFGIAPLELLGARPSLQSSAKPPFRPDVRCETQEPPNLDSGVAAPPPTQTPTSGPAGSGIPITTALTAEVEAIGERLEAAEKDGSARVQRSAARAVNELDELLAEQLGWENLLEAGE